MSIYEKYSLNQVINASGKMTILGVSKYVDVAIEAQKFGGKNFFEMTQLNRNVGQYLANLIGAEDSQIVSSASAGIAQSVAGLIGEGSQFHLYHPYDTSITKREIIVPKGHNVDFGAPIETIVELGGGQIVEAGYANMCRPDHIANMITEDTVAILYVKSHHSVQKSMLSIKEAIEVAHKYKIPLIVDAAAEEDLSIYIKQGADLVIYSGAKALEGTSSGIVFGKKEYIEWVRMQGSGVGRAMKIGKENILGLAAAIEYYLEEGPETGEEMKKRLYPFLISLNDLDYINAEIVQDGAGRDIYRVQVSFTDEAPKNAMEIVDELESGSPAVYTRNYQLNNGIIEFDIRSVNEEEMGQIVAKLQKILTEY
jgi:L-seryl-tRNA(Ser) seleniumtransferase